jgi:hypothetical protein
MPLKATILAASLFLIASQGCGSDEASPSDAKCLDRCSVDCNPCPALDPRLHQHSLCTQDCWRVCLEGWDDCDGDPTNGCETDTTTTEHCSRCEITCNVPFVTNARCEHPSCAFECEPGRWDFDYLLETGCEMTTAELCEAQAADNETSYCKPQVAGLKCKHPEDAPSIGCAVCSFSGESTYDDFGYHPKYSWAYVDVSVCDQ